MTVLPAALGQLISNQSTDFQNLAYALYDIIAALSSGDVTGPAIAVSGDVVSFNGVTGKLVQDSGKLAAALVTGPASAVSGDLASFNGTTGKIVLDSGVLASAVVVGPASAVNGNVCLFDGVTGKLIKDGGAPAGGGFVQFGEAKITSGDLNTASTTFVDAAGVTVTLTTGAHRCQVSVTLSVLGGVANSCFITLLIDGVNQGGTNGLATASYNGSNGGCGFVFTTAVLSAAAHTFKIQFRVSASNASIAASATAPAVLQVVETGLTT